MSYGLYIGGNLTFDGHAWIGGYGDEPSSHWLELIPAEIHPDGAEIRVGVTPAAAMPGQLSFIPQTKMTLRQLRVSYSHYRGVPAPITNGGLNEFGVAVRDIWSPSRPELVAMTSSDQRGPNYSDFSRLILDRARTAREGVELISSLIETYGYSCYGGNSHLIADSQEAFVVIEFSGGLGLWVAERLGPNDIRASRPGYIGVIPDRPNADFIFPQHFISKAVELGWYQESDGPFDVNKVYGDGKGRSESVCWIESEMRQRAAAESKITFDDVVWAIATEKLTGDTAGYGQIVPLINRSDDRLRYMWHCPVGAVTAPFVPIFIGVENIAAEYGAHRYLTEGEAARFLDPRKAIAHPESLSHISQSQEVTRSAFQIFKSLMHVTFLDHDNLLPIIASMFRKKEQMIAYELADVIQSATLLIGNGRSDLAMRHLTDFTNQHLIENLNTAEHWLRALESRHRIIAPANSNGSYIGPSQIW